MMIEEFKKKVEECDRLVQERETADQHL